MSETCRICAATGDFPRFAAREMMYGTRQVFDYVQCTACKTLQIAQVPQAMADFYPQDYYSLQKSPEQGAAHRVTNRVLGLRESSYVLGRRALVRLFEALKPPVESTRLTLDSLRFAGVRRGDRVLDVGCGSGAVLHRLSMAGFRNLVGADPHIAADLRYDSGFVVMKRPLEEVSGEFDLITFHHSLEHVPDPQATLSAAARLLAPRGKILVRVPTVSSEAWDTYGVDWVQLDAPRHLYLLSRQALSAMGERAGLRVVADYDDSTALQFLGSEQYRRGIPLTDETSVLAKAGRSIFPAAQVAAFAARARELNAKRRGDQVVFLFSRGT